MPDSDRWLLLNFQIFKTEKSEKTHFVQKHHFDEIPIFQLQKMAKMRISNFQLDIIDFLTN